MTAPRSRTIDRQGIALARELALQRKTCAGCHALQTWPRPMCKGEKSPHFRTPRDTYHERCELFGIRAPEAAPRPEPLLPLSRYGVAGQITGRKRRKPTDDEHAALLARNAAKRVAS